MGDVERDARSCHRLDDHGFARGCRPVEDRQLANLLAVPHASLFSSGLHKSLIGRGETVLVLPFTVTDGDAMFWQVETHGYFRMTNGYGNFIPPGLAM